MPSSKSLSNSSLSKWVLLPLRLFLGITFVYAGVQKLTDPQFLQPSSPGFIGKQIAGFALSSPLHTVLLQFVAPHALLFGLLVAYGEFAIGLGTLTGLLLRPAAFFGLLLSCIFFLSLTWGVYPYFYGADIVFMVCWITLLLNGASNTGYPTLDETLSLFLIQHTAPARQLHRARLLHLLLGTPWLKPDVQRLQALSFYQPSTTHSPIATTAPLLPGTMTQTSLPDRSQLANSQLLQPTPTQNRRTFLFGLLTGVGSTLTLAALAYAWHILAPGNTQGTPTTISTPSNDAPPTPLPMQDTPQPTATSTVASSLIAQVNSINNNSAVTFTIPTSNDPGVLVRLNDGQFVAYDATCTHAGCQVDYDPALLQLVCPCHGARYDPAHQASVVHGPAIRPLDPVAIHVDSATGAITLS